MTEQKRKTPGERKIDAPVLALEIDEELRRLKTEPKWISGTEDGITLAKYPHMRIVLVALRKGKNMHEHKVGGPMSVYVISGKIRLTVRTTVHLIREKGLFTLRKAIVHDVRAEKDSVFLLTIMAL